MGRDLDLAGCHRADLAGPPDLVGQGHSDPRPYETSEPPRLPPLLPELPGLRAVGARVDGLTIAVAVELDARRVQAWHSEAVEGQGRGVVSVAMPGFWLPENDARPGAVAVQVQRVGPTRLKLENADMHGVLDEKGIGGCQIEITFRATFLATATLHTCCAYVRQIAASVGVMNGWKLRRVDLAVDVAGWKHEAADAEAWVTRPRAVTAQYAEMAGSDDLRVYRRGENLTGFTVCPGGAVQLRCYDKREELAAQSPEKRQLEEHLWSRAGWDGVSPVARAEFQLRSEALDTFQLRDPETLEAHLDGLWQYLVSKWVRLVQPGTNARKSRCLLDSRWELLTMVKFQHKAEPMARTYIRRGAGAKQALGGLLSFAAAAGVRRALLAQLADPEAAEAALRSELAEILAGAVPALAAELAKEHGHGGALHYVRAREALAVAKHATAGVVELPELPPLPACYQEPTPLELAEKMHGPVERRWYGAELPPCLALDGAV